MQPPALTVRGTTFAAASPVIVVPLVASDAAGVLAEAERAVAAGAGCLEWRADHLRDFPDVEVTTEVVAGLRRVAGDVPLLATVRTLTEGGQSPASEDDYLAAVRLLVGLGVDLVDVEVLRSRAREAVAAAHAGGVRVVGSRHAFDVTPPEDAIVAALAHAETLGADLAKVAVMPADILDTLTLLRATARRFASARTPLITIAMGREGALSRVVAPAFGSCATFATVPDAAGVERPSAPGQVPLADVRAALDALAQFQPAVQAPGA